MATCGNNGMWMWAVGVLIVTWQMMSQWRADISTSGFSQEEPMSESALEGYIEVSMITDITDITDILCFFILDPMTYEIWGAINEVLFESIIGHVC